MLLLCVLWLILCRCMSQVLERIQVHTNALSDADILSNESMNGTNASYNMGDLLNMPSFWGPWLRTGNPVFSRTRAKIRAKLPESVLGLYFNARFASGTFCQHRLPYRPRVLAALDHFAAQPRTPHPDEAHVRRDDTLLVHMRLGDRGVLRGAFFQKACEIAPRFKYVILLSAVHADVGTLDTRYSCANTRRGLREMELKLESCARAQVWVHVSRSADADLLLMRRARHLLVSMGGFSMLGAWVCEGTVYMMDCSGSNMEQRHFMNYEFRLQMARLVWVGTPLEPDRGRAAFDAMAPLTATCCQLVSVGLKNNFLDLPRAGPSVLCRNAPALRGDGCWAVSVGSHGGWGDGWRYEAHAARRTGCHIHTFDCARRHPLPKSLAARVTFHELCGRATPPGAFPAWRDILRGIPHSSATPAPAHVRLALDGHERALLASIIEAGPSHAPQQIAVQVHAPPLRTGTPPPALHADPRSPRGAASGPLKALFDRLADAGYRMISRYDDPHRPDCTNVLLMHNATVLDFGSKRQRAFGARA